MTGFIIRLAGIQGFEPQLTVLETGVLPVTLNSLIMERATRVELAIRAWKAPVLPLHQTRSMELTTGIDPATC